MSKKTAHRIAAVIDIGSNEVKLKIAQAGKNSLKYLENLSYPLRLGRDTFQTGKMSFEKADKACDIIKNFLTVTASYGITAIKAVATTAVREATNMDYILDQIKIKTGLRVNVIDDAEEKLYVYKLLTHYIRGNLPKPAMMVYIGSGNVGVSLLLNGRIPFMQNIRVGSLRVGEMFEAYEVAEFYRIMDDYIATFINPLAMEIPGDIGHFYVSGHDIGLIAELCGASMEGLAAEIPKEQFLALYDDIKYKDADRIATDYGIDSDKAEILLPAACIYQNLLKLTEATTITASRILPSDAVLYEMLYPKGFSYINKQFGKNTLLSARMLAKRYDASVPHYTFVSNLALLIFARMKKVHGLGSREKLLLQVAAILHDIGHYVNIKNHDYHSYELISGSDIVGLSHLENDIVALICLFHSTVTPTSAISPPARYTRLIVNHRMMVSKLAAILRIADALDRSHMQKLDPKEVLVRVTDDDMIITVGIDKNIVLEQWAFNVKARFFEEVFGMKAVVKVKSPK